MGVFTPHLVASGEDEYQDKLKPTIVLVSL